MGSSVFDKNVVIITGASTGIGKELALQLSRQGATVILASRDEQKLAAVAEECRRLGGIADVIKTDVGKRENCEQLISRTVEKFGRIDTLINNAGYGLRGAIIDYEDVTQLEELFAVNFFGSVSCTQLALPHLVKTKGRIVALSSVAGLVGAPGSAGYCATKFAMRGFFNSLRMEVKKLGISVTMIYPGYVVTEFAARVVDSKGRARGKKGLRIYNDRMMTARTCASKIAKAAAKRRRSLRLTAPSKIAPWISLFAPCFLDRMTILYKKGRERALENTGEE